MTSTEELERLMAEATPGPWINWGARISTAYSSRDPSDEGDPLSIADCDMDTRIDHDTVASANAALIVAAVNALPGLIESAKRVERLEAALKFYADPSRWPNMPNPENPHYDMEMDAGTRARTALKGT